MSDTNVDIRVAAMATKLQAYLLAFDPAEWQLFLWIMRQLAQGQPLTSEQVVQRIASPR